MRKLTDTVALQVRLPEGLRRKLAAEAEKSERSLNGEILWRLGQTLTEEWQEFIGGMGKIETDRQDFIDRMMENPEFREKLSKLVAEMPRKKP
jgi:hypothetical protein